MIMEIRAPSCARETAVSSLTNATRDGRDAGQRASRGPIETVITRSRGRAGGGRAIGGVDDCFASGDGRVKFGIDWECMRTGCLENW
jgi:hypothetical protein